MKQSKGVQPGQVRRGTSEDGRKPVRRLIAGLLTTVLAGSVLANTAVARPLHHARHMTHHAHHMVHHARHMVLHSRAGQVAHTGPLVTLANQVQGDTYRYTVQAGDTLSTISSHFGEDRTILARENGLNPDDYKDPQLHVGQALVINNRHIVPDELNDGILVNLSQRRVFLFNHGHLQNSYLIAAGDPSWPTPSGSFHVINKIRNKTWIVPVSIQNEMRRKGLPVIKRVPPGPDNPLGKAWIGLSLPNIGIHGTNSPNSIFRYESHGCMRMRANDLEQVFDQVHVGEKGRVVYQPLLMAVSNGRVYLEAHPNVYKKTENPYAEVLAIAEKNHISDNIDWQKVAQVMKTQDGIAQDVSRQSLPFGTRLLSWLARR